MPPPRSSTLYASTLLAAGLALANLSGCAVPFGGQSQQASPWAIREQVSRMLPINLPDRDGWARDIQVPFTTLNIPPSPENLCAVLAVTEQQSDYQISPDVPGLPKIARAEIEERADLSRTPRFLTNAALNLRSSTGETYNRRLEDVRTERELNAVFDDFIQRVPLGSELFGNLNPVQTGGPMQVNIDFALSRADSYPYPVEGHLRDEVFSRQGGMFFGIARLLDYPASYEEPIYRFADYHAGWHASRNAAFQDAVSRLTGIDLTLDGKLTRPNSREPGETEIAVRSLGRQLGMNEEQIRQDLELENAKGFENTRLFTRVFRLADRLESRTVPRAMVPRVQRAPKHGQPQLSTELFAKQVDERYQQCLAREIAGI